MNKYKGYSRIWSLVLLLVTFVAGCASNGPEISPIADITRPTVSFTSPADGAINVPIDRKVYVSFSEVMKPSTLTAAGAFTVKDSSGVTVDGTVNTFPASATFTPSPTTPLTTDNTYTVTIKGGIGGVADLASNTLAVNYVFTFKTGAAGAAGDVIPPIVSFTNPANGTTDVPIDRKVYVGFSEVMDPATITPAGAITVKNSGGITVDGTVTTFPTSAIFTPSLLTPFITNETYTVTIKGGIGGVADLASNTLAANYVFIFKTGAAGDTTPPVVSFTNPLDGATDVPLDKIIYIGFSEVMEPSTIIATGTITMKDSNGITVDGTVAASPTSATFTPSLSTPLINNTTYTVTVKGGIGGVADLATNVMVNDYVFSFKTAAVSAPPPPPAVNLLGSASKYGIMAVDSITDAGSKTHIYGDVSLEPGTSIGLLPAQVTGTIHKNDSFSHQAGIDLLAAYGDLSSRTPTTSYPAGVVNLSGKVLTTGITGIGVYATAGGNSGSETFSLDYSAGPLVLDAEGNADAVFIFQASDITSTTGDVVLRNGAQAKNVFWVMTNTATIGGGTFFQGTIVAGHTITLNANANVEGRMLAGATGAGAITLSDNIVTVPAP